MGRSRRGYWEGAKCRWCAVSAILSSALGRASKASAASALRFRARSVIPCTGKL